MLRSVFCLVAVMMSAATVPALAETPWRINNIPLDMPVDEELNGEFLEGIYQEKLMDRLIDSILNEWPSYNIKSTLKAKGKVTPKDRKEDEGNERMEIYFSSAADHRRAFWIRTDRTVPDGSKPEAVEHALQMIEKGFAKPDRVVTDPERPGNAIVIIVDTSLPPAEQDQLRKALPDPLTLSTEDFGDFWAMDLQQRAKVLGTNFRGAVVLLNSFQGKLLTEQVELLDLKRAQTVFNLTP